MAVDMSIPCFDLRLPDHHVRSYQLDKNVANFPGLLCCVLTWPRPNIYMPASFNGLVLLPASSVFPVGCCFVQFFLLSVCHLHVLIAYSYSRSTVVRNAFQIPSAYLKCVFFCSLIQADLHFVFVQFCI